MLKATSRPNACAQFVAQAAPAMLLDDENVGEVCKRGAVCNYACEANLRFSMVNAKTE